MSWFLRRESTANPDDFVSNLVDFKIWDIWERILVEGGVRTPKELIWGHSGEEASTRSPWKLRCGLLVIYSGARSKKLRGCKSAIPLDNQDSLTGAVLNADSPHVARRR